MQVVRMEILHGLTGGHLVVALEAYLAVADSEQVQRDGPGPQAWTCYQTALAAVSAHREALHACKTEHSALRSEAAAVYAAAADDQAVRERQ